MLVSCITVLLWNCKFCDLGSLTFGKYSTFVYGPLFWGMRPIVVYSHKQGSIQKYNAFEEIENPSDALEVTLGSSTNTNIGHRSRSNPYKI